MVLMNNLLLPALCSLLVLMACGATGGDEHRPVPPKKGETVFNSQCALCHGRTGTLGLSGAKDLTKTTLTRDEMIATVTNGKGGMMAYAKVLSVKEIGDVVDYARTLRKPE